jgi:cyclopropane fatty-acyl-phospholipid synthase-like methyltransferase
MRSTMTVADFEALYRADDDPWNYRTSAYERAKYDATLTACGHGPFRCALELGGSIGVFSELLAPRCDHLITIDAAPTAVAAARRRLAHEPRTTVVLGKIPDAIPCEPYDLVVASEILYYLSPADFAATLAQLERTMVCGSRLVAVHWRSDGPERPRDAAHTHAVLRSLPWLEPGHRNDHREYLLDVLRRR